MTELALNSILDGLKPSIVQILSLAFFLLPGSAWSFSLGHFDGKLDGSLNPPKGDGVLGVSFQYAYGSSVFDSQGNRMGAYPRQTPERYYDLVARVLGEYSLTDRLAMWIDFPIVYRKETHAIKASDWGIGDVEAGALYRILPNRLKWLDLGLGLGAKFPSGDTDLGVSNATTGQTLDLPLGSGTSDVTPFLALLASFTKQAYLQAWAAYTFRFDTTAEYLRTDPIGQTAPDGSIVNLPIGNLSVDWGDEFEASTAFAWSVWKPLTLKTGIHAFFRKTTVVRDVKITTNSAGQLDFVPNPISLSSSQVFSLEPAVIYAVSGTTSVVASAKIPLRGENYPTISYVESYAGNRFKLEIRYAF